MRLLKYDEHGELDIVNFDDRAVPPYAILSHTWGTDAEEVTFADIITGGGKAKNGYEKIRFCGQQAQRDNLRYFWVDTCCIDKTDKAELSHAIRSMFRWYQNTSRCYVYLPDVSTGSWEFGDMSAESTWEPAFRLSRWFTRGWTLQELLAPSTVEFFSQEGTLLGDKMSLKSLINKITGIPCEAFDGAALSQFSIDERLRWKGSRETKREEDAWYSLSGILDVEIAPAYSEGAASAFKRLMDEVHKVERCLQDIRCTDPRDDKKRIEDTKGGLLADSYRWILDNAVFQHWQQDLGGLLWVKGDPGKGKTMLLCGIIDELHSSLSKTSLLAYFFCQATDSRINSATAVLRGLLYMLIKQQPSLISHIRKRHDDAGKALLEDANAWVALTEVFTDVLRDPGLRTTYLVIDALDECVTDLPKLLDFIARQSPTSMPTHSSRNKWIVSSRNWPDIEEQLGKAESNIPLSLELNADSVSAAVGIFIQHKVSQLSQQKKYDEQTQDAVLKRLISNANDTFLWVALVCQDLQTTARRNVLKKIDLFPPGLDALYKRMMQQISVSDDAALCKQVLALIGLVYRPITLQELVVLAEPLEGIDEIELRGIIGLCGSFLTLRKDAVYFVHQSAKDFLFAESFDEVFPGGTEVAHQVIFSRSLVILTTTLQRDMYNLEALGVPIEEADPPDHDPLAASRYPCVYWVDHLHESKPQFDGKSVGNLQVEGVVDRFIREKYLYWLEGLSLCRSIGKGVSSMAKLYSLVQEMKGTDELTKLVYDARRFVMYHKGAIESYPLQTYASALLFSPTGSIISKIFHHEKPKGVSIEPVISTGWSACLQTLEGHIVTVTSIAFSHDSTKLASASSDKTVKIWDLSTAACLQTFVGHKGTVTSIIFSHNSTKLVSASSDITVKVWDISSGTFSEISTGHLKRINSIAISHDSTQLVSGSEDCTVKLLDMSTSACLHSFTGHSGAVMSVALSHNSTRLASASADRTIKLWDMSGMCLYTLTGHEAGVKSIVFSHDSMKLASASNDKTIKLWDVSSGMCLQTLIGHSGAVISVAFSRDSTKLASASYDFTVKLWDANSGVCLQTFKGHGFYVISVVFSHDGNQLASASNDGTIKLWDVSSSTYIQTVTDHSHYVISVSFVHDLTRLVSASRDNTVKLWDASHGVCLQTFEGHSGCVSSVAFSHDLTELASASHDDTIKIWDVSSGACLQTLTGHSSYVTSVAFPHDSTKLVASASNDKTAKLWDTITGACLQTFTGHKGHVSFVGFLNDSTKLRSVSDDMTIRLWDMRSGACLHTFDAGILSYELSGNAINSYLYTKTGPVVLRGPISSTFPAMAEPGRSIRPGTSVSRDYTWIQHDGKNTLWIPSEYRPSCFAKCGNRTTKKEFFLFVHIFALLLRI
ncbi:WD40-repeat-containing domain protein [Bipolaris maydis]|uniref:WD40-repeat-containing domain protein n=1 Tax=Cochliobolus heterostrophus TaxID=5016 RepID=UPI0024D410D0|nr:WD40-repeat-containing domain protein [Bipolaris maydis]